MTPKYLLKKNPYVKISSSFNSGEENCMEKKDAEVDVSYAYM